MIEAKAIISKLIVVSCDPKKKQQVYSEQPLSCIFTQGKDKEFTSNVANAYQVLYYKYKLDAETKVTKRFRNPRARGCSVLSEAKALLRAQGFLNRLVTVG